jgi:1-hydroxycarotenoid 3,4-desaturase
LADERIIVVGAGIAGLVAAADLARRGVDVLVCERGKAAGGKVREIEVGDQRIAAGPTVFTMRWIFEGLFADAGERLADHLDLVETPILARHAWRSGGRLDLFADVERSVEAIAAFAGPAEARGYRAFCRASASLYRALEGPYMGAERPSPLTLVRRLGWRGVPALLQGVPTRTLWRATGEYFDDPRLRQLFARYATYVGASPFAAPATLMLIAHVEQDGVWLVRGGIGRLADALRALAERQGARFRFAADVAEIAVVNGRAAGVRLSDGERLEADAIVYNGDVSALPDQFRPVKATRRRQRSLSAVTWCLNARTAGFPLAHHNVFFTQDYAEEFTAIFDRRTVAAVPTVYICAQDRGARPEVARVGDERLLLLVNAPADGDLAASERPGMADLKARVFAHLAACGLAIEPSACVTTTPADFHDLFPATGGALYGRVNHGAAGSFSRAGARALLPGLYLAGGSVHPGPGLPMAAMSGRLAAARLVEDLIGIRGRSIGFRRPG